MRIAAIIALCLPLLAVAQPVVPGFERFPRDTPAQQVTAGEVLITELNCVACQPIDPPPRIKAFSTLPTLARRPSCLPTKIPPMAAC